MKATAKHKVVTSGRLTGGAKAHHPRRQVNQVPPTCPEPAYSLYSTDPEEQVTTLHQGLDRCAALLNDMLKADAPEPSPRRQRALTGGAAKSRTSMSVGKKATKKVLKKPVQKNPQSVQRGGGSTTTPRSTRQCPSPAAHSGVKLHPPVRRARTKAVHSPSVPPPQTSVLLSVRQSSARPSTQKDPQRVRERDEEADLVPVRDTNTATGVRHTLTSVTSRVSEVHGGETRPLDAYGAEKDVKQETIQFLLGELKALITGQGSVAERLLSHLEQAVSERVSDVPSLHSHAPQINSCVRALNQQLKERDQTDQQQNTEGNAEVKVLQGELSTAQSRVQELQQDLTELRKALEDTQRQLRGQEAEVKVMKTDLEVTRRHLVNVEQEKSDFSLLAQHRLEENDNLRRLLRECSARPPPASGILPMTSHHSEQASEYLMPLTRPLRTHAEREGGTLSHLSDSGLPETPVTFSEPSAPPHLSEWQLKPTQSQCHVESVLSDCSMMSGSSFNTRDEVAFRDGLAALDASIASLQRTMQLDLRR